MHARTPLIAGTPKVNITMAISSQASKEEGSETIEKAKALSRVQPSGWKWGAP